MASSISMWHTQTFCDWDIAYKILGPPGSIPVMDYVQEPHRHRIGIFALNIHGISDPQELLQKHEDATTPKYPHRPCVIISGDLHCVPDDYIDALSWIGSGVLQCSDGWRYNDFPFSIALTQDFPRSNAVYKLSLPAYLPPCTPSSIGKGPHWLPDKVTGSTSTNNGAVMPGNLADLGWHPTGKNYSSDPIDATEMQSSAWGTTIIDLSVLNGVFHRANCPH